MGGAVGVAAALRRIAQHAVDLAVCGNGCDDLAPATPPTPLCPATGGSVILPRARDNIPLAYLITFRSYGTWLHGDGGGSVDRFHNQYGSPYFPPNDARLSQNECRLTGDCVILNSDQRQSVEEAIRETCDWRKWLLRALNVRTNHVHAVVSTQGRPELVLNALKANATRQLRQEGQWRESRSPWPDGGSRRYVWTEIGLERAIDYVINGQDGVIPELGPPRRKHRQ